MDESIEKRKENLLKFLKEKKNYLIYVVLAFFCGLAFWIRTRNLSLLNGQLADPDAHLFYRYAEYILEHGKLFINDPLRYFPVGYNTSGENIFVSYFIVYLYKFLHIFMPALTLKQVDIMYPAIVFIPALIFFYLLVKKLFDWRVGLLASGILAIIPGFLFRTMSGVSDKEGLAILFLFMTMYFFVCAWKEEKIKKAVIFSILTVISTTLLGASWGGIQFIFLIFALSNLIAIFLDKFNKKDFFVYGIWYLLSVILLVLFVPGRFSFSQFIMTPTIASTTFVFFVSIVDFLYKKNFLKLKDKFEHKAPHGIISLLISSIVGILFLFILKGPSFFVTIYQEFLANMLNPFGQNRWALTVAESRQPYFVDWIGDFSMLFFFLFILASILLFYEFVKPIKKMSKYLTLTYIIIIFGLIFSRYSPTSILNGSSTLSNILYFGSIALFVGSLIYIYLNTFYKNKEIYHEFLTVDKMHIFILIWLVIMLISVRGAIRLEFVLVPVATLLASHIIFWFYDLTKLERFSKYKLIAIILILVVGILIIPPFVKSTFNQSKYIGPIYDGQWQAAEQWVKNNTKESDVFVHWWDYGYLVQTGFNRATVTDGGNSAGAWNYFVGRHVLTGQNETEALEFMKMHDVSYLLMVSDEIGKYTAFSSIGSDVNYDRFSWLVTNNIDEKNIQQTRDGYIYFYPSGIYLDEDLIINGNLYPTRNAGIGGFFVPTKKINNLTQFEQPTAALFYNNNRLDLKLSCLYFNGKEYDFDNYDMNACLRIIPTYDEQNVNPLGSLIYISPRVKRTLFSDLYLLNKNTDNIKLVYSTPNMDLLVYNGRLFGPLKIWKISYPSNIRSVPVYLSLDFPDMNVTIPNLSLYG